MLDLAAHIVQTKSGHFDPSQFEDRYENALVDLLKKKQAGEKIEPAREIAPPRVVNLMDGCRSRMPPSTSASATKVFEHIFDYGTTMSEIARVLKPGAISIHSFPGPNNLMEGHVGLPFPWLCYSRAYLTLCAWLRVLRGIDTDWRQRVQSYADSVHF